MRDIARRTIAVACLSLISSCEPSPAWAFNLEDERLATAVWHAEGGTKAKVAYGVLSVKVAGPGEARQVTLRSIRNHRQRHAAHSCGLGFLDCWSRRWAPLNASNDPDGLNRNWLRNVRYFLDRGVVR